PSNSKRPRKTRLLAMAAISSAVLTTAQVNRATAQSLYWDVNGSTSGAGGPTPTGAWDAISSNWNAASDGTGVAGTWSSGNTAVFAAGTDATGAYTITVDPGFNIAGVNGITFEEGNLTIAAGDAISAITLTAPTITATAGATINA